MIYLDHSATTPVLPEVAAVVLSAMQTGFANPSSGHRAGFQAEQNVRQARRQVASVLKVTEQEIIFTSGGTESNHLAIEGYLSANPRKGKHIVTTAIEHPAVLEVFRRMEKKGYSVTVIGTDSGGQPDLELLEQSLNVQTALISMMAVNNETGTILPLKVISDIRKRKAPHAVLHTDAVQAFGKIPLQPGREGIDLLSLSGHKLNAPKGVGALYVRKGIRLEPIFAGGGQENGMRAGTLNVPGIAGLGVASELACHKMQERQQHLAQLRDMFISELSREGIEFHRNSPAEGFAGILNISFPGVKSQVLLQHLEAADIMVSAGSACSSKKRVYSHVLEAMRIADNDIEGAVRVSFGHQNQVDEILHTVAVLKTILPKIQITRGGLR